MEDHVHRHTGLGLGVIINENWYYSPDMNPIEKAYSKLKAFLRKIAERSVAGLMRALEACADIFKSAECENYFKACGYDTD